MTSRDSQRPLLPRPSVLPTSTRSPIPPRVQKCSGGTPCQRCRQKHIPCILDRGSDRRRTEAVQGRIEALERDRSLLSQSETESLLNGIRSCPSVDEMRQFLSSESQSRDHLQYHLQSSPWTTVTNNSNYVSRLISLYFTWVHPVQQWIDRDLFIRDMQKGDLNSKFCSPFLVNALLAVACSPSRNPETAVALPGSLEFHTEAKRLFDQEKGRLSLTSFQGRCALTWARGTHILAWQYLVDITDCVRRLLTQRNAVFIRSLEDTVVGSFSVFSVAIPGSYRPSIISEPPDYSPRSNAHDHHPEDLWRPYSAEGQIMLPLEPVSAHTNCVFNQLSKLQLIMWKISKTSFPDSSMEQLYTTRKEMADASLSKLRQWASGLPECLSSVVLMKSPPTPAIADLHLRYHCAILDIYKDVQDGGQSASIAARNDAQRIRLSSAQTICSLLDLFVSHWSAMYMPFTFICYAHVALSALLSHLDSSPIARDVRQRIVEQARQLRIDLPV
ncbi:hypothetical protein BJY04DRAFT_210990 [Aspergillus karnatakaensis]|uniref:fungal specific transcription factor domain-containing protein n=1 Tax=Aspergillus karnatakaensis TaxID=1810916 RepID=UPI003CCCC5FC